MEKLKKIASEILEYSKMIYLIQEDLNPEVIFGDKRFIIDVKDGRENIKVKKDYEEKDTYYHFETSKIMGIITKKESGNYSIKARVKYKNDNNIELWFAKLRIEIDKSNELKIMGCLGGSLEQYDFEDNNLIDDFSIDVLYALYSMRDIILKIYEKLSKDKFSFSEKLEPDWVKRLKKYNNK